MMKIFLKPIKLLLTLMILIQIQKNVFLRKIIIKFTILKLKNRKFSDDTKKLMRENHSDVSGGKNPAAKKVKQYSLDGRFIREYSCIKEASDFMKIGYKTITKCCKDTSKSVKGYFWRYIDE